MSLLHRLEARLPGRATLGITVTFRQNFKPDLEEVAKIAQARGYQVLGDSLTITFADNQPVWRFAAVAIERTRALSPAMLAQELSVSVGIARFSITPKRPRINGLIEPYSSKASERDAAGFKSGRGL